GACHRRQLYGAAAQDDLLERAHALRPVRGLPADRRLSADLAARRDRRRRADHGRDVVRLEQHPEGDAGVPAAAAPDARHGKAAGMIPADYVAAQLRAATGPSLELNRVIAKSVGYAFRKGAAVPPDFTGNVQHMLAL